MKIWIQTSVEGDWCRATAEGVTIYDGHDQPGPLLRAIISAAKIPVEYIESDSEL